MTLQFEAGAVPSRPLLLAIRDELDNPVNIVGYTNVRVEMLGQNGEDVDLTGIAISQIEAQVGVIAVTLPRDRSLFEKRGIYTLRVVLENQNGTKDITRTGEIEVREFGRIKK